MLPSDTRCFHCNTPVPGRAYAEDTANQQDPDIQAAARYGLLVLMLMVLGILLLNWMGVHL